MSKADYRLCDVCGEKAFYDDSLHYEQGDEGTPYRVAGKEQYKDPRLCIEGDTCLSYLGDWAVICLNCSKQFRTQIVPIRKDHAPNHQD